MKMYFGVDVCKARLDVDWQGKPVSYDNQLSAIKKLIGLTKQLETQGKQVIIVVEATGGYEQKLVRACREAKLMIHIAHANKVRYFAKSIGLLAKTDKIDARVLTQYGELLEVEPDRFLLNEKTEKLASLLKRREQLLADRKREQNRLDKEIDKEIETTIKRHIQWLDEEINALAEKLSALKKCHEISVLHRLLTSIPAIGDLTGFYLLSYLPELGRISNKALAALVGVAPFNHDSGKGQGKRFVQGGRSQLRRVLYMAAMAAIRSNAPLRAFYQRLRARGKFPKVAIIAVIRKLLSMANSVMKRRTEWISEYQKI